MAVVLLIEIRVLVSLVFLMLDQLVPERNGGGLEERDVRRDKGRVVWVARDCLCDALSCDGTVVGEKVGAGAR